MFKCRSKSGRCNLSGPNIRRLRQALPRKTSQQALAYLLQLRGIDLEKNAIQSIEAGRRFVTDIELKEIANVLGVTVDELVSTENSKTPGECVSP